MKVVIAMDDSVYSRDMLHLICRRHWPQDVQFKIVTVIEPIPAFAHDEEALALEIKKRRDKYSEKLCTDARHFVEQHIPGAIVHFEIREGVPSREILLAAAEWEANKILIGAHGHGICPHNLLGSVSRTVAERAMCTVEIIRTVRSLQQTGNSFAKKEVARA
ncbi:MAG: universal stress protein [Candidatus Obscuribacterales bacterium]|jgi:nucleotide-binding universal stress UspA family protein|nr:universal stress protein [Candidatus Obscuribacterales bacterium]